MGCPVRGGNFSALVIVPMGKYLQVTTTTSSAGEAERLASKLLEARLAACIQIVGPISSKYWWQNRLETSVEWQCTIKTRDLLYAAVESLLLKHHSYDIPEIIAVPIVGGSQSYLSWLDEQLTLKD